MKRIDLKRHDEAAAIVIAIEVLNMGGIVAYPTETFYALGAKADSAEAIENIFSLKGRGPEKSVSLIVGDEDGARALASEVTPAAEGLMRRHWPGPLTLVLRAAQGLLKRVAKDGTVAIRIPGDSFALRLAREAGFAITATSANPAGQAPAMEAHQVEAYFPEGLNLLIDGGQTPGGTPTTIADATGDAPRVLRQGNLRVEDD